MPQSRRNAARPAQPGSIVTQAQVALEELERCEYLVTRCAMKQAINDAADDDPYIPAEADGPVVSYREYRQAVERQVKRIKDVTPPAALRLAQKRQREQAAQVA